MRRIALLLMLASALASAQPSPPTGLTLVTRNTFPNASNTGVPAGTSLTAYTGSCTLTSDTTIDAKTITCDPLQINGGTITITRSQINGYINIEDTYSATPALVISDSTINCGTSNLDCTGIASSNITATRINVYNGKRPGYCWNNCTITYSFLHGQTPDVTGQYHQSGFRMGQNVTLKYNTIACDAPEYPPEGGCSAALTGYPDFQAIKNNLIEGNLFLISQSGGYCAYGGATGGKPYSSDSTNATYIRFINNYFERNASQNCGVYGPIIDYDGNKTGNQWTGNRYFPDGAAVPSD